MALVKTCKRCDSPLEKKRDPQWALYYWYCINADCYYSWHAHP